MGVALLTLRMLGIREATGVLTAAERDATQGQRERLKRAASLVADEAKSRTHSRRVRNAIGFDVEVRSPTEYSARVGPERRRAFFAHFLEFGTKHSRAFPFLLSAAEAKADQVVDIIGEPFRFTGRSR